MLGGGLDYFSRMVNWQRIEYPRARFKMNSPASFWYDCEIVDMCMSNDVMQNSPSDFVNRQVFCSQIAVACDGCTYTYIDKSRMEIFNKLDNVINI